MGKEVKNWVSKMKPVQILRNLASSLLQGDQRDETYDHVLRKMEEQRVQRKKNDDILRKDGPIMAIGNDPSASCSFARRVREMVPHRIAQKINGKAAITRMERFMRGPFHPCFKGINSSRLQRNQGRRDTENKRGSHKSNFYMGIGERAHIAMTAEQFHFDILTIEEFVSIGI